MFEVKISNRIIAVMFQRINLRKLSQITSLKRILASTSNNALISIEHRLSFHRLDDLNIKKSLLRILNNRIPNATLPDDDAT